MENQNGSRQPYESQVDILVKALEIITHGPRLLFHARYRQSEHPLTELYEIFEQDQPGNLTDLSYEQISKVAQRSLDRYISTNKADVFRDNIRSTLPPSVFAIFDDRPPSSVEYKATTKQAMRDNVRSILGFLISVHPNESNVPGSDVSIEVNRKLSESIPHLQQACYCDLERNERATQKKFFTSLIQLNRIAQGETTEKLTGHRAKAEPIFSLGAEILFKSFEPDVKTCAIFDARSIRYVHSSSSDASSSDGESSKGSRRSGFFGAYPHSDGFTSLTTPDAGMEGEEEADFTNDKMSPFFEEVDQGEVQNTLRPSDLKSDGEASYTDAGQSYVISSSSMHGAEVGTFVGRRFQHGRRRSSISDSISTSFSDTETDENDRHNGKNEKSSITSLTNFASDCEQSGTDIDDSVKQEDDSCVQGLDDFGFAGEGRVLCSFPRSKQTVALLGHHGGDRKKYSNLDGNFLRRVMAGYFASARQTGFASQVHCEFEERTNIQNQSKQTKFRQAMGAADKDDVILTAACFDRLRQPAFMITLLTRRGSNIFDQFKRQVIELIGITLSNALLHTHAEELSQAQSLFTQKVQHELRTPLHGILGINEAVLYTLRHAQSPRHQRTSSEDDDSILRELVNYTESIANSADDLSALVDDLVDFSIPNTSLNASLEMNHKSQISPKRRDVPMQMLLSVLSSASERRWQIHINKHVDPTRSTPEFMFWFDPLSEYSNSQVDVELEALRRMVTKIVTNALEATVEGIVRVEVHLEHIKYDAIGKIAPSNRTQNISERTRRKRKTHIMKLVVKDTGYGMSHVFLADHVFQAYQKEDANSPGIGLSLALCRTTIERMGGHIVADSEEKKGSVITITIPVALTDKTSAISSQMRRGSAETFSTVTPDLQVVFFGVKYAPSLRALRDALLQNFGMLDVTEDLNLAHLHKVDVVFLFPDGLSENEERILSAIEMVEGKEKNPLTVIMSEGEWKSRLSPLAYLFVKGICSASRHIKEVQRPLNYDNVKRLIDILKQFHPQSSRNSISSDQDEVSASSSTNSAIKNNTIPSLEDMQIPKIGAQAFPSRTRLSDKLHPPFKVLVVEDNPINAKIITTLLRRAGIDFAEAFDGEEGVNIFKRDLPAVVLLDINMPKMNGFDAAIAMRAHPSPYDHHIAAVTALSSETDRVRGFEAGMDTWYTKPMRMAKLIEDVQKLRNRHQIIADFISAPG